ncbi:putative tail fiber protein [Escherichia phage vB_EcoM_Bp10]|uniref:putative tail fiber protein n=1 Tax=Escherichia phage vB_EcoM_Bp10 TaxID=2593324 RepID=UPI0024AE5C69|nr:putative tail fiber protein [Escherichia phage vB_EcoM_Bp10]QEM42533.1 putative tail fiber protein [Escherichia phage vB_EcoM_Bp10]
MAKGYSLDALVSEHYMKSRVALGTTNLDTYTGMDNIGVFYQYSNANATSENGYPAGAQAGSLEVLPHNANKDGHVLQRYTNYADKRMWVRSQSGNQSYDGFYEWTEFVNMNNIYNAIYPIGIVLQFDNATNPNNVFTGTVWEQITDGRAARAATGPEAGTADGKIGSVAGSDTAAIAVANLPGHTHGMQNHTHGIAAHSHTMSHTHTINHDHGAVASSSSGGHHHSVSGSTSSAGDHTHSIGGGVSVSAGSGKTINQDHSGVNTRSAGAHTHSISGSTNWTGDHTHTVDLPNFTGTSGGSSAGSTGGTALTTGGPSNNETTSTGGGTALNVRNSSHYYAFWKRTA